MLALGFDMSCFFIALGFIVLAGAAAAVVAVVTVVAMLATLRRLFQFVGGEGGPAVITMGGFFRVDGHGGGNLGLGFCEKRNNV